MARKNRTPEESARREKIRELLQMANIDSMDDIQNLFKETIAEFMEKGLAMQHHNEEAQKNIQAQMTVVQAEIDQMCFGGYRR